MLPAITVLMILMTFLGHCRDFYYINDLQKTAFYQCFKQKGYNQVTTYIQPSLPDYYDQCFQHMRNIKNADLELGVVLILCRNLKPEKQIQIIVKNMGLDAIKQFWVYFEDNCGWQNFTPEQNCEYLQKTIQLLKSTFGVSVGVMTDIEEWQFVFGSQTFCPQVKDSPLWWFPTAQQQNYSPDFANYRQIGGWAAPALKFYDFSRQVCTYRNEVYTSYYP